MRLRGALFGVVRDALLLALCADVVMVVTAMAINWRYLPDAESLKGVPSSFGVLFLWLLQITTPLAFLKNMLEHR